MEFVSLTIQVLLLAALLFALFLYKNLLPKYFEEKGKNLATKQDIGEITNIVEGIKTDLNKETEILKSQLSFNNQNKFSIKSAEREALFNLHSKFSIWLHTVSDIDFSIYSLDNHKGLDQVAIMFNKAKIEFNIANDHLTLFMHDKEIFELIKCLVKATLLLEHLVIQHIIDLKHKFTTFDATCQVTKAEDREEYYKSTNAEILELHRHFFEEEPKAFEEVHNAQVPLVKLIKKRIDSIVSEENNL